MKFLGFKRIESYLSKCAKFFNLFNLFEIFEHAKVFKSRCDSLISRCKVRKIWKTNIKQMYSTPTSQNHVEMWKRRQMKVYKHVKFWMKMQNYFNKQSFLNMWSFLNCDLFNMTGFERRWPMLIVMVHVWRPTKIKMVSVFSLNLIKFPPLSPHMPCHAKKMQLVLIRTVLRTLPLAPISLFSPIS